MLLYFLKCDSSLSACYYTLLVVLQVYQRRAMLFILPSFALLPQTYLPNHLPIYLTPTLQGPPLLPPLSSLLPPLSSLLHPPFSILHPPLLLLPPPLLIRPSPSYPTLPTYLSTLTSYQPSLSSFSDFIPCAWIMTRGPFVCAEDEGKIGRGENDENNNYCIQVGFDLASD